MDKEYIIDEIFGCKNVKVQAIPCEYGCPCCYFWSDSPPRCFKPAFIDRCIDNGRECIFVKINK